MDQSRLIEIVGNAGVFTHPELGESFSLDHKLIQPSKPALWSNHDVGSSKIVQWPMRFDAVSSCEFG
jgi:hypothetical protein